MGEELADMRDDVGIYPESYKVGGKYEDISMFPYVERKGRRSQENNDTYMTPVVQ